MFLPYIGMVDILFNDAGPFEQIDYTLSTENPMWNLMKVGPVVSEKKTLKDYNILYMYTAQGQGQIIPGYKNLIVTLSVCYFDHTL